MNMRTRLASSAFVALFAAYGPASHGQFSPPTRDVENPARTPFWANATINLAAGFGGVLNSPVYTAPPGRRAVVEHVAVRCVSPAGNAIVRVLLGVTEATGPGSWITRSVELPLRFQGTDPFSGPTFVAAMTSRLYSDPNPIGSATVVGGVIRETGAGTGFCTFFIDGHLITI